MGLYVLRMGNTRFSNNNCSSLRLVDPSQCITQRKSSDESWDELPEPPTKKSLAMINKKPLRWQAFAMPNMVFFIKKTFPLQRLRDLKALCIAKADSLLSLKLTGVHKLNAYIRAVAKYTGRMISSLYR